MRRFLTAAGSTALGVLRRRWLLMLLLASLPAWFFFTRILSVFEEWSRVRHPAGPPPVESGRRPARRLPLNRGRHSPGTSAHPTR